MQKVKQSSLIRFGYLVLELMGKGVVISKGKIGEESSNYNLMQFLLNEARKVKCYGVDLADNYKDNIKVLNEFICQWIINSSLDRDEKADNCHIYNENTQGLNTLLVVLIDVFDRKFELIEEDSLNGND